MTSEWVQEAAGRLSPAAFRRFLRTRGWSEELYRNGKAFRFTRTLPAGVVELDIPSTQEFADYARRAGEAIGILAVVEDKSPAEIVTGLQMPAADTLEFRFAGEALADGTIPLDDAWRVRTARKQLLLAAAHSAVEPLPHFPRLSRAEPAQFLASCRELPARAGSYVTSVLIPVSPAVGTVELEAPFARRVTELLAQALCLASEALASGDDAALLHNARAGLSSNFLTALAQLAPPGGRGSLEIGFHWAYARPLPAIPRERVRLDDAVFAPLAEAARALRETTPVPGYELEGYIARLERDEKDADKPGSVVLATTIEERPGTSKVHLTLDPELYRRAVEAHVQGALVRVTGTLERQGRRLVLQNPGGFCISHDED